VIDFKNASFFKLEENSDYGDMVSTLLADGESVVRAYKGVRDGVVFTDKRIIAINVQGATGKKKDFTSLPYSKIVVYSIETEAAFDRDVELELHFGGLGKVKFQFAGPTNIVEISNIISRYVF
jgi:hypothetical protein